MYNLVKGKNGFAEISKNLGTNTIDTNLKITLFGSLK